MPPKKGKKTKVKAPTGGVGSFAQIEACISEGLKIADLQPTNLQRLDRVEDCISTGSLVVDLVLGGGWPPNLISIPVGPEQSGKSTLAYYAAAYAIELGIFCMFFGFEGLT